MLAFLLGLLKIIGIVLLVILVVLLLLAAVVLLVPIKYQAQGQITETKKQAMAKATWLCKLIRFKFEYSHPDKPMISLKILWIDLLKEKKEKKPKKEKKTKEPKAVKEKKAKKESKKKEKYHPAVNVALLEAADAEEAAKKAKEATENGDGASEKSSDHKAKSNESEPIKESETKIEKIIFKIQGLYDKINKIINKIEYYLDIYEERETQELIKDAWISIRKILVSIKPKDFHLNAIIGFEMPDTTGRVYGYYCMMMPWLCDEVNLEPDFEQKIINGDIYMKGKIRLLTIVVNALKIAFDKRLKPLIKKIKNGGK